MMKEWEVMLVMKECGETSLSYRDITLKTSNTIKLTAVTLSTRDETKHYKHKTQP